MNEVNLILTLTPIAILLIVGLTILFYNPNLRWVGYSFLFVAFVFLGRRIFKEIGPITSLLFSAILVGIIMVAFGDWLIGILLVVANLLLLLLLWLLYWRE